METGREGERTLGLRDLGGDDRKVRGGCGGGLTLDRDRDRKWQSVWRGRGRGREWVGSVRRDEVRKGDGQWVEERNYEVFGVLHVRQYL